MRHTLQFILFKYSVLLKSIAINVIPFSSGDFSQIQVFQSYIFYCIHTALIWLNDEAYRQKSWQPLMSRGAGRCATHLAWDALLRCWDANFLFLMVKHWFIRVAVLRNAIEMLEGAVGTHLRCEWNYVNEVEVLGAALFEVRWRCSCGALEMQFDCVGGTVGVHWRCIWGALEVQLGCIEGAFEFQCSFSPPIQWHFSVILM